MRATGACGDVIEQGFREDAARRIVCAQEENVQSGHD